MIKRPIEESPACYVLTGSQQFLAGRINHDPLVASVRCLSAYAAAKMHGKKDDI